MTDKEAMRVALACAIDKARDLPKGKTKMRVTEAARVLYEVMKREERWG